MSRFIRSHVVLCFWLRRFNTLCHILHTSFRSALSDDLFPGTP